MMQDYESSAPDASATTTRGYFHHEPEREGEAPPANALYYMARARSREESKLDPATGDREQ